MKNLNCNQINIFIYLKIIGEKIRTNFFFKYKKKNSALYIYICFYLL